MFVNPFLHFCETWYSRIIWLGSNLQSLFLFLLRLIWGHQLILVHGHGLELICGSLLLVGFASRLAALPLIIDLMLAVDSHVFSSFHFISDPSILVHRPPFPFLMVALMIFLFGPGRISIDAWIRRRAEHWKQF